jgi:transcriptional regulator with XRE-family HTH domain
MEHEESRTIGQLLKADRVGKGLSQENYARELGMRRVYLAQIEEGHPKYPKKYIPAISAMLGISIPMLAQIAGVLTAEDELIHEVALHEEHARYTINGHADQLRSEATALIEHFDERQLGAALQVLHMIDETPAAARLMVVEMRPMDADQS